MLKILAQSNETANVGNDIYMANIVRCLHGVLPPEASVITKPLIRSFALSRALNKLGAFAFNASKIVDISRPLALDFDLVVISGPRVSNTGEGAETFIKFMKYLKERNTPYALLSCGSYNYGLEERDFWCKVFEKYPPLIFSTRDDYTYDTYGQFAKYSLKSVCTSLFSSINFPITKKVSLVGCWDDNENFTYDQISKWIDAEGFGGNYRYRAIVDPFALGNVIKLKVAKSPIPCLISLSYMDYLDYYSQTSMMFSSRVHCCAPVLSYGGEAVLLNKTGRKRLFDAIGVESRPLPSNKQLNIFSLNPENIRQRYDEFTNFLKNSLSDYFSSFH